MVSTVHADAVRTKRKGRDEDKSWDKEGRGKSSHRVGVDLCHVGEDGHDRHRTELAGVAEDRQGLQS